MFESKFDDFWIFFIGNPWLGRKFKKSVLTNSNYLSFNI